jgi:hypothetical protein
MKAGVRENTPAIPQVKDMIGNFCAEKLGWGCCEQPEFGGL